MGHGEGRAGSRNNQDKAGSPTEKRPASERLRDLWPDIWVLIKPRRGLLLLGFVLICISRVCGFALPISSRYLFDNVIKKHQVGMLFPLTMAVLGATAVQGITAFTLTQLLSIEGQKLIAQLRRNVQKHVGRLPI